VLKGRLYLPCRSFYSSILCNLKLASWLAKEGSECLYSVTKVPLHSSNSELSCAWDSEMTQKYACVCGQNGISSPAVCTDCALGKTPHTHGCLVTQEVHVAAAMATPSLSAWTSLVQIQGGLGRAQGLRLQGLLLLQTV
jgi:hypothetical protein